MVLAMTAHKNHLDRAYTLDSVGDTQSFYADWAQTYDAEIIENGYATPARCAQAVAQFVRQDSLVLDTGCGTGLSGLALKAVGFSTIDGFDITEEMLVGARARHLYRALWLTDPGAEIDVSRGPYDVMAAIGVIGNGAAPLPFFHDIIKTMSQNAHFVFSFNDHMLEDPRYEAAVNSYVETGQCRLVFKEYGPHFPKRDVGSNVYVLKRL